jgi:hypothetical protein
MDTTHLPLPTARRVHGAPAYTALQRAEIAEAFKAAKPHLDEYDFICIALQVAGRRNRSIEAACHLAEREVMHRLFGENTVTTWLVHNGCIEESAEAYSMLLPYRHRWLDSLIAEFSTP